MWIFIVVGFGIVALAHTAPAPFLLDALAGQRAVWHMPRGDPPTIYLTFDDDGGSAGRVGARGRARDVLPD